MQLAEGSLDRGCGVCDEPGRACAQLLSCLRRVARPLGADPDGMQLRDRGAGLVCTDRPSQRAPTVPCGAGEDALPVDATVVTFRQYQWGFRPPPPAHQA